MEKAVSAADANRRLSRLLDGVREGQSYVVTRFGKPVARIIPVSGRDIVAEGARTALLARLRSQRVGRGS